MGKFHIPIPREFPAIDYSSVLNDIHNMLLRGKDVFIIYDPAQTPPKVANSLLKKLPLHDVYQVPVMDKSSFENHRTKHPERDYYQISAEQILLYFANIPDAPI